MPETNNIDIILYLLIGIVAILFLILLSFGLISFIENFSKELKYINLEIQRTYGLERRYWIHRRRRLWLSLLPFVKY